MQSSPIIIAKSEEASVLKNHGFSLVEHLVTRFNKMAVEGEIPVDYFWTTGNRIVMGENKTPEDFMSSHTSGHLTTQLMSMKEAGALGFVLIEGDIYGDGDVIGYGKHAWVYDRFENVLCTLQTEGFIVTHVKDGTRTPRRLASLYDWSSHEVHDGWLIPEKVLPSADGYGDEDFRWKVGMLMHVGGRKGLLGAKKAEDLLLAYGLMGCLGITEDALSEAHKKWLAVDGIGKKTADKWYNWLRG